MKLRELAAMLNAEIEGNAECEIQRVAKIEEAGEGDVSFVANPKYAKHAESTAVSSAPVSLRRR